MNKTVDIEVTKKLIKKRNDLKRKLKELKDETILHEKSFSPITKHLEIIADKLTTKREELGTRTKNELMSDIYNEKTPLSHIKKEERISKKISKLKHKIGELRNQNGEFDDNDSIIQKPGGTDFSTNPVLEASFGPNIIPTDIIAEDIPQDADDYTFEEVLDKSVQESKNNIKHIVDTHIFEDYLNEFHELPRTYLKAMQNDRQRIFDHRTGIRHDSFQEKYYIGTSEVEFKGPNVQIAGVEYVGTPGLYDLLFLNHPGKYTNDDLFNYKEILLATHATKRNFNPDDQYQGTKSDKHKQIIAPLFEVNTSTPKRVRFGKSGKGMFMEVNNNNIDYVHWDDPNELVDRLRLLVASQKAGNTGHKNECVSIIEELREASIID